MSIQDIRKQSETELKKMLAEERGKLHNLRFQTSVNRLRDVAAIKKARKRIAQIHTVLSIHVYDNR